MSFFQLPSPQCYPNNIQEHDYLYFEPAMYGCWYTPFWVLSSSHNNWFHFQWVGRFSCWLWFNEYSTLDFEEFELIWMDQNWYLSKGLGESCSFQPYSSGGEMTEKCSPSPAINYFECWCNININHGCFFDPATANLANKRHGDW